MQSPMEKAGFIDISQSYIFDAFRDAVRYYHNGFGDQKALFKESLGYFSTEPYLSCTLATGYILEDRKKTMCDGLEKLGYQIPEALR